MSVYNELTQVKRVDVSNDFAANAVLSLPAMTTDLDRSLIAADAALKTLTGSMRATRAAPHADPTELSAADRALSGALMRVNHVGEVCAQALYQAQALTARTPELRTQKIGRASCRERV